MMISRRAAFLPFLYALAFSQGNISAQDDLGQSEQPSRAEQTARDEIAKFFEDYEQATQDETGEQQIELYDVNRLVAEIMRQAEVDWPDWQQQGMAQVMRDRLQQQLRMINGVWYRHKVVRVDFLDGLNDAEVFIRVWTEDEWTNRQLVWLHRTEEGWRIYDVADLSVGIAYASMGAIAVRHMEAGTLVDGDIVALRTLLRVVQLMNEEDLETAADLMEGLTGKSVPGFFESIRWFIQGGLAMQEGGEEAIEHIEKAAAFQPDFPMLDYLRALAYNLMSRHEKAGFYARRYLARFGDDADAYVELAKSLYGRENEAEAIEMLRKALADTPNSLTAIEWLAVYLPEDNKQAFLDDFRKLRSKSDGFQYLADSFEILEEGRALEKLVAEMLKTDPEEPLLDYYQAVVMSLDQQHSEAMNHLIASIRELPEDDEYVYYYETLLRSEAVAANRLIELYREADDPAESFQELVQAAINEDMGDAAKPLIESHLTEYPEDAAALTLAGDVDYYAERYGAADERYEAAWQCDPEDQDLRDEILYSRAMCWIEMDRLLDGYAKIEPKDEIFNEFAEVLSWDSELEKLGRLLNAHREHGHSLTLAYWEAWLKLQKEDYAAVIDLLGEPLQELRDQDELSPYLFEIRSSAEDLLVRSLIRSQRLDEALQAAESMSDPGNRAYYAVIVHAVARDRAKLRNAIEKSVEEFGYAEEDFLYDDDYPKDDVAEGAGPAWLGRLRAMVMLLSDPIAVDAFTVTRAAKQAWDMELFVKQYSELTPEDTQFVCQLSPSAVIIGVDQFRFFVQAEGEPLYGDAKLMADEAYDEKVVPLVQQHTAWTGVDVYVWPQEDDDDEAGRGSAVPPRAQRMVASLAVALAGSNATVLRHRDTGKMQPFNQESEDALLSPRPMSAFYLDPIAKQH